MTAVLVVLIVVTFASLALAYWVALGSQRLTDGLHERDEEIDRLERALGQAESKLLRATLRGDLAVALASEQKSARTFVEKERDDAYANLELVLLERAA